MCLYCGGLGSTGDGYHTRKCIHCKGTGCDQSAPFRPSTEIECPDCDGIGFLDRTCIRCAGSGEGMADGTHCASCAGSGVEFTECETCRGTGEMEKESGK